MANRRNIILADCEEEEIQEFAAGMQEVFGEAFDVRSKICNGGHGKWNNMKRYFTYFIYPFHFAHHCQSFNYVIGWQQFFALFYAFYCRLLQKEKCNAVVVVNFTYKKKSGWMGYWYKKWMVFCLQSKYLDYIHVPSWNYAELCAQEFHLPKSKFIVTHFGLPDTYSKWKDSKVEYNNYSFSIGRSNRDFEFLVDAWRKMPEDEILVIASDTFHPKAAFPPNVIHRKDITGDRQFPYIANCKMMIIPILDGTICSGDTVLLKAMSYEKLVVVTVPSTLGEMYIEDGVDGVLVEKDNIKFQSVVSRLLVDNKTRLCIAQRARIKYLDSFSRFSMGKSIINQIKNGTDFGKGES